MINLNAKQVKQMYLELHGREFVEDVVHLVADDAPGDLVLTLSRRLHGVT